MVRTELWRSVAGWDSSVDEPIANRLPTDGPPLDTVLAAHSPLLGNPGWLEAALVLSHPLDPKRGVACRMWLDRAV